MLQSLSYIQNVYGHPDKTRKGGYNTSLLPELRSYVLYIVGRLTFRKMSDVLGCLVFRKEVL